MTDQDLFAFMATVKRMAAVFRLRADTEDFKALAGSYFRALIREELIDLERAADVWIGRESKFPRPNEWRAAIVRRAVDVRTMTDDEAREWDHAERLRYEEGPCGCAECVKLGIWQARRFVPDVDSDERDRRVQHPFRNTVVTAGHWAHGVELQRWYRAKAAFYQRASELGVRVTLQPQAEHPESYGTHTQAGKVPKRLTRFGR